MPLLYDIPSETVKELLVLLTKNLKTRRLEKGLSRPSGVPVPTIAKFEQQYAISLVSYVALAKALGYTDAIKALLAEPRFTTMEELETIHKNKNRKKGRNVFNKKTLGSLPRAGGGYFADVARQPSMRLRVC